MKKKIDTRLAKKAEIKNALTLPRAVLYMLTKEKIPPLSVIHEALECIDEVTQALDEL